MYKPGKRTLEKLRNVHPQLVAVILLAMARSLHDFGVTEGERSYGRQTMLVAQGRSKTMKSMHLLQSDGYSYAVDTLPSGYKTYEEIPDEVWLGVHAAIVKAADDLGVDIQWGNDWDGDGVPVALDPDESFVDKPHYQLRRK